MITRKEESDGSIVVLCRGAFDETTKLELNYGVVYKCVFRELHEDIIPPIEFRSKMDLLINTRSEGREESARESVRMARSIDDNSFCHKI